MVDIYDVFTPDDYPKYTYVERKRGQKEDDLEHRLRKPSCLVSISGLSKSGKSMLLKKVADKKLGYTVVEVGGNKITSSDVLWSKVQDKLKFPKNREVIERSEETSESKKRLDGSAKAVKGGYEKRNAEKDSQEEIITQSRRGLSGIVEEVDLDNFVLFIDDAHYIDEEVHSDLSESLKDAYEEGMKICAAYIPHRSASLMKANPDLEGRVNSISLEFWDKEDLKEIAEKGFEELNLEVEESIKEILANEAVGSPHLMQKFCLNICREMDVRSEQEEIKKLDIQESDVKKTLRDVANQMDRMEEIYAVMNGEHNEGSGRGRKVRNLPEEKGDVYDLILRAIADETELTLSREGIIEKIRELSEIDQNETGNVIQRIISLSDDMEKRGERHKFDWNDELKKLEMSDPNMIFYIRWSNNLIYEPEVKLEEEKRNGWRLGL